MFKSPLHKKLNVNQLEFLYKMFESSCDLSMKINEEDLEYFIDLICLHGRYPEFLKVFDIIAKNYENNPSSEISKKILTSFLIDDKLNLIDVINILVEHF